MVSIKIERDFDLSSMKGNHLNHFSSCYIPICYFDETSKETRAAISHPKISLAAEAKLFSSRNIGKREDGSVFQERP